MIFLAHIVVAGELIMNDKSEILLVKNPRKIFCEVILCVVNKKS